MTRLSFDQWFAMVTTVAVVGGISAGFWVLGTPGRQRAISADRQRIRDISSIAHDLYWQGRDKDDFVLPEVLPDRDRKQDPLTNQTYRYQRLTEETYQLCAEFDTDTSTYSLRNRPRNSEAEQWEHPEGQHCFEFDLAEQPSSLY